MYIMVVGGGKVGYYLVKELLDEGHEVLVLEKDAKNCEKIVEEFGSICMRGDGCEAATLAEAGTERAEMFIAVTRDDEDNLVACQVAKHKFKVPRTIARITNPKNEALFKKLGIDVTISSTNLILEHIEQEVPTHPLIHLLNLEESGMEVVEIKIPPDSAAVGKTVQDIPKSSKDVLVLILRKGQRPLVPTPDTVLEAGDQVVTVIEPKREEAIRSYLTGGKQV
jgi:trk system potassium uptake protein TrkA